MNQPVHASAPAKLILCGEHAVVYQRPAIAVALSDLRATATISPNPPDAGIYFHVPDLGGAWSSEENPTDPLCELARNTLQYLGCGPLDVQISLRSSIPIAGGMGSGAAIGTALVRALAVYCDRHLSADEVAHLVYTSEQRFHGTPSGIDNTVIAHEQAIWFVRGDPPTITPLKIAAPLRLIIGDTGVRSATRLPVGAVRERYNHDPERYTALFEQIGELTIRARNALAGGELGELGRLLDRNHELLEELGVSSPELQRLVHAARKAGALGAKLSGAGWGGVMLALVADETADHVGRALRAAGAERIFQATVDSQ